MKSTSIRTIIALLITVLLLALITSCRVPHKTPDNPITEIPIIHDTIYFIDAQQFEIQGDTVFEIKWEECDPCPPQTIIGKQKNKNSNNIDNSINLKNCFNENNDLKRSVLVKDSQIDSLVAITGKRSSGTQTTNNANNKWWVWFLIGIGVGGISYQLIRTLITKKI